jgi:hypothetical protein
MKELQLLIERWKQEFERLTIEIHTDGIDPILLLELCTKRNRLQFCITDVESILRRCFNEQLTSIS